MTTKNPELASIANSGFLVLMKWCMSASAVGRNDQKLAQN